MTYFNRRPFNYLPLHIDELFDLTSEYLISLFERLNLDYTFLCKQATELTDQLLETDKQIDFELLKNCFLGAERLIDTYSKIVKCCKLSLGEKVGNVASKRIIFQKFTYSPNSSLQGIISGLRNTQQHFEERLQDYDSQIDPFVQLSYVGINMQWKISFGNGGYRFSCASNKTKEIFNTSHLILHSYEEDRKKKEILDRKISIADIWKDTSEIIKLIEDNLEDVIEKKGICCPPIRHLGVTITPS